jgi:hypothetical protein
MEDEKKKKSQLKLKYGMKEIIKEQQEHTWEELRVGFGSSPKIMNGVT